MWRRAFSTFAYRPFSTNSPNPPLSSFLKPSIFTSKPTTAQSSSIPSTNLPKTLTLDHMTSLQSTLHESLQTSNTDEAWRSFKTLTSNSAFPSCSCTSYDN